MLDVDREDAVKALKLGENIFLTGKAGAGKTHLAKEFAKSSKHNVALCATTGIAALNLGGETIHRFLGIGITTRPEQADQIIKKWARIKRSSKPWDKAKWKIMESIDAIVIDEASMLRRDQFELIEAVLSGVRDNGLPFGGVQIILVGDFFQLPPVVTEYDKKKFKDLKDPYCFQSVLWNFGSFNSINLTTNYRQSDLDFLRILNDIRIGKITDEIEEAMQSRLNQKFDGEIKPIKLFPFKADVATENIECLKKIKSPKYLSEAEYTGKDINVETLKKDCPAEDKLYFCKGAQIIMLTNEPNGKWVNGSMGIITDTDPVMVKLTDGRIVKPEMFKWEKVIHKMVGNKWTQEVVATMTQYPFKLAYATTIHKSQGLTLDYVDLDLTSCFAAGQAYVALSRVRNIEGLSLRGWSKSVIKTDPRVLKFYKIIEGS